MNRREELIKQQERLLEVYEKVKDMLAGYPNVVNVGIGIKEKDGKLTDEGCIKIIVKEKKSEEVLGPNEIIPKGIEGFKTDVIVKTDEVLLAACTSDERNYRPIKGGIRIGNYRGFGEGTLGCLAQLDSDNSWVLLSNHHVLYGVNGQDNDEIGQPRVGCSWCCKTNIIAKNSNKNEGLDCAIAKINSDISITNVIEEIGIINGNGASAALAGERVRKRGSRTGFTSGTISFIDPPTKRITITPKAAGGPANDPGGCTNYEAGRTIFAYFGDSGSVVVNDNNEVIALLNAIDSTHTLGLANDILQVQTAMGITIKTTSSSPGVPIAQVPTGENILSEIQISDSTALVHFLEERLKKMTTGRLIIDRFKQHEMEIFNLVNKHRPVTITWHRKQGPAFLAAFGRSVKNPEYIIPTEINRVSIQNLLMSMAYVLEEHGSGKLREDIKKYATDVIQASKNCSTAEEFLRIVEQFEETTIQLQPQIH